MQWSRVADDFEVETVVPDAITSQHQRHLLRSIRRIVLRQLLLPPCGLGGWREIPCLSWLEESCKSFPSSLGYSLVLVISALLFEHENGDPLGPRLRFIAVAYFLVWGLLAIPWTVSLFCQNPPIRLGIGYFALDRIRIVFQRRIYKYQ